MKFLDRLNKGAEGEEGLPAAWGLGAVDGHAARWESVRG